MSDDAGRIAVAAERYAAAGEEVAAVVATEPSAGRRVYLVAFTAAEARTWLALDAAGEAITSRDRVREAVSIAAMVEVVEEALEHAEEAPRGRVASPHYLNTLGATDAAAVGAAVQSAAAAVEELANDVVTHYKLELT